MQKALLIAISILLASCERGQIVFTAAQRVAVKQQIVLDNEYRVRAAVARNALFVECMDLAAQMPRQADDDVSDIVDSCSLSAYYMTRYLIPLK